MAQVSDAAAQAAIAVIRNACAAHGGMLTLAANALANPDWRVVEAVKRAIETAVFYDALVKPASKK